MVENQHQLMKTYRDLSQNEIDIINIIKEEEESASTTWHNVRDIEGVDQRWVNIARTHLQEGFSALVRAVARPDNPFED
jgi:hypothetical protein